MDSLYAFKCKSFRNTRHTVTFAIPCKVLFQNNLCKGVVTVRISRFLGFTHRPELETLENTMFRKLDLIPSSGEGKEKVKLALSEGHNRVVCLSLHPEKDSDPISETSCFLLFRIPDDGRSP
jgi:hypothetical protein